MFAFLRSLLTLTTVALPIAVTTVWYATGQNVPDAEAPFLSDNQAAMKKMMDGMDAKPSGDVDRDFAASMIPHHQGAIDMAQAELRYGHNERLRRIAQEIVIEQQQEIVAMRQAFGQPNPVSTLARVQLARDVLSASGSMTMCEWRPK
jgi:uncharacterized protein (DUF305 family)